MQYEVVIPAWNSATYLPRTLASVRQQVLAPVRVTVVDDGSTDETAAVASQLGAEVLRLPHRGVVQARNAGLEAVRTPFALFLDSDDVLRPEWAARLAETFGDDISGHCAVGTMMTPFGDADLTAWTRGSATSAIRLLEPTDVWERNPFTASGTLLRVASVRSLDGWREECSGAEDYDLTLRLSATGCTLALLEERLVEYRVRPCSFSSDIDRAMRGEARALQDFASVTRLEIDVNARLRALWWRSVARGARGRATSGPPPLPDDAASVSMRLIARVLREPIMARWAATTWRGLTRARRVLQMRGS